MKTEISANQWIAAIGVVAVIATGIASCNWGSPCSVSHDPIGCEIIWQQEAMNR